MQTFPLTNITTHEDTEDQTANSFANQSKTVSPIIIASQLKYIGWIAGPFRLVMGPLSVCSAPRLSPTTLLPHTQTTIDQLCELRKVMTTLLSP